MRNLFLNRIQEINGLYLQSIQQTSVVLTKRCEVRLVVCKIRLGAYDKEWPRFRPHVHLYTMISWVQTVIDTQKSKAKSILLPGVNKTIKTSRWFRNSVHLADVASHRI